MESWQTHGPPLELDREIQTVKFSPDSRLLVTHSRQGVSRLWDTATAQPAGPIRPLTRDLPEEMEKAKDLYSSETE